jgi:hypothetical protein
MLLEHLPVTSLRSDLLILMLCAPHHREQQALYRSVWQHCLPKHVSLWFVEGGVDVSGSAEVHGDVLYVPCVESYECLAQKVFQAIHYYVHATSFSYLFKCDVNTYVNISKLAEYPYEGMDYIGAMVAHDCYNTRWHLGKCQSGYWNDKPNPNPHRGPFAAGGVGYFLSRKSANIISAYGQDIAKCELYEDKMVGDILRSHDIRCCDDPHSFDLRRIKNHHNPDLITRKTMNADQLSELLISKGL